MPAKFQFFRTRSIWWPTALGWITLATLLIVPVFLWCFCAEAFLTRTTPKPAEALILEGWIGSEGIRAAKEEFERGGYRYLVTAGNLTESRWGGQRWNYAIEAQGLLIRLGVPSDRVVAAPAPEVHAQRTFSSALAVRQVLDQRGLRFSTANVFTLGVHARRSRLVFAKVLPDTQVGAISWRPSAYSPEPWWHSSERAEDLIKETVGYLFELLLNSGRSSNSVPKGNASASGTS